MTLDTVFLGKVWLAQLRNCLFKQTHLEQLPEATSENLYNLQPHAPSRNFLEYSGSKSHLDKDGLRLLSCLLNFVDTRGLGCHGEASRKGCSL